MKRDRVWRAATISNPFEHALRGPAAVKGSAAIAGCGPLTITGWQTVVLVVVLALIVLAYGELCARDAARRTRDQLWAEEFEFDEGDCERPVDEANTVPIELDEEAPPRHRRHSRGHDF